MHVEVDLDLDEVADSLAVLSEDELVRFFNEIDDNVADWSFTARIAGHFLRLLSEFSGGWDPQTSEDIKAAFAESYELFKKAEEMRQKDDI